MSTPATITDTEVIECWHSLYTGSFQAQQYLAGNDLYEEQLKVITELAAEWRERLMLIRWFMCALNENIARLANPENDCSGRFLWKPSMVCAARRRIALEAYLRMHLYG
ncbi:MAG: hypothetical protein ABJ000_11005 [Saccharospirillum sp.]|uniref:hypothetical protein n=1 Tax=Saccharospirillum sp. TaxID=2033801 RepID=UPI0032976E4B